MTVLGVVVVVFDDSCWQERMTISTLRGSGLPARERVVLKLAGGVEVS